MFVLLFVFPSVLPALSFGIGQRQQATDTEEEDEKEQEGKEPSYIMTDQIRTQLKPEGKHTKEQKTG